MLSKKFVEAVVSLAKKEDLETFVVLIIEHLKKAYPYNAVVDNALQLITGVIKPYTIDDIDLKKVKEKVKTQCYKAENAEIIHIKDIDSISLEVEVEYKKPDDKYISNCRLDIDDLLKEE